MAEPQIEVPSSSMQILPSSAPGRSSSLSMPQADIAPKNKLLSKKRKLCPSSSASRKQPNTGSNSYESPDTNCNKLPSFQPNRSSGIYLDGMPVRRTSSEIDFFRLFFTDEIMADLVKHTNTYAWANICKKKSYADSSGAWQETTVAEMEKFIAALIYQGIVKVPTHQRYWSTKTLYHGLWAREMMSFNRFKALLAMLHVVDIAGEKAGDKLRKVSPFINHFKERCTSLFQPDINIAVDERLVKSKHRSGIRQYIKNKPVKFGIKLWVVADSHTGYTCDFNVYAGKTANKENNFGLGYTTVMELCTKFLGQGYNVFFDNFYTSPKLVKDLYESNTPSCGTITMNRKGFPDSMKDGKTWARKLDRGSMRWKRDGPCLAVQWKDNKLVTMLSSIDSANEFIEVKRKVKVDDKWENVLIRQPKCIQRYNRFMNAVDRSDQYLAKYNLLHKCVRWWKTLFFHMIDISLVNGFIIFQQYRKAHPELEALCRPSKYGVLEYREAVIRQLIGLKEIDNPPVYKSSNSSKSHSGCHSGHLPEFTDIKRNCKLCYMKTKKEKKVFSICTQCNVYLHVTKENNCFSEWHLNNGN